MAELARGWYVVETSRRLGHRPVPLRLAGRELVAWRTRRGVPVVMGRYCPHQGAALDLGEVRGESLRCAFHHWRYDATGACVAAPDTRRIPDDVAAAVLPVWEGIGYVWAWVGSARPDYPPPTFSHLDADAPAHRRYAFAFQTNAPARRILENGFDVPHFAVVHGIDADLRLAWDHNTEPHLLAARLSAQSVRPPSPIDRVLPGIGPLCLDLRSSASYQVLTFELDGAPVAHELLAVTPTGPGSTTMRGWTVMPRGRGLAGTRAAFWGYRLQHWEGTRSDLRVYRNAVDTDGSVNTADDEGVLRFRQFYRRYAPDDVPAAAA